MFLQSLEMSSCVSFPASLAARVLVWTLWPSGMLANTLPALEEEEEEGQ